VRIEGFDRKRPQPSLSAAAISAVHDSPSFAEWQSIFWFSFWVYCVSWSLYFCAGFYSSTRHLQIGTFRLTSSVRDIFIVLANLAPGFAAIIISVIDGGLNEVRRLFARLTYSGRGWASLAAVCLILPLADLAAVFLYWRNGGRIAPAGISDHWFQIVGINIILGPVWEELAWRGYLLPKLEELCNGLLASFILAGIWGMWHWPLHRSVSWGFMVWFVAMLLAITILITVAFNASGGSLVPGAIIHIWWNFTTFYILQNTINAYGLGVFRYFVIVLWCMTVIFAILHRAELWKSTNYNDGSSSLGGT